MQLQLQQHLQKLIGKFTRQVQTHTIVLGASNKLKEIKAQQLKDEHNVKLSYKCLA